MTEPILPLRFYKTDAVAIVRGEHAKSLRLLTGNATREEVDTWTRQLEWARIVLDDAKSEEFKEVYLQNLLGMMTAAEVAQFSEVRAAGTYFAGVIVSKSIATDELIVLANGIKRRAEAAIYAAETHGAVDAALSDAANKSALAEEQFLIKSGA